MLDEREKPPLRDGGLSGTSSDCFDTSEIKPPRQNTQAEKRNPRAVREAKLELLREAIFDACGFIALHADVCQTLAQAHDDAGLLHSLDRLILYAEEAARSGNDLRAIREAPR